MQYELIVSEIEMDGTKPVVTLQVKVPDDDPTGKFLMKRATIELGLSNDHDAIIYKEYYENEQTKNHPAKDIATTSYTFPGIMTAFNANVVSKNKQIHDETDGSYHPLKLYPYTFSLMQSEEYKKYGLCYRTGLLAICSKHVYEAIELLRSHVTEAARWAYAVENNTLEVPTMEVSFDQTIVDSLCYRFAERCVQCFEIFEKSE